MTRLSQFSIVTVLAITLSACATASGPIFTGVAAPANNESNVYLYRKGALFAIGEAFEVSVDGAVVGRLYNKSYLRLPLKLGSHTLKVAPGGMGKASELKIDAVGNTNSFYEYDFVTGPLANFLFIGSSIKPAEQTKAVEDLKELKAGN